MQSFNTNVGSVSDLFTRGTEKQHQEETEFLKPLYCICLHYSMHSDELAGQNLGNFDM